MGEGDTTLAAMWLAGHSQSEIAVALNMTRSAVAGRVFRAGLQRRKLKKKPKRKKEAVAPRAELRVPLPKGDGYTGAAEPPSCSNKLLWEIGAFECHAVIGEPIDMMMCGAIADEGSSWCDYHAAKYRAGSKPKSGVPYFFVRRSAR